MPYPGLRAFRREESIIFFGREDHIDAMIDRLAATRFLAVLGASGSGKSSLVRTGLFDALEKGFFARAGARWRIVDMHPGGTPLQNLAEALAAVSGEGELSPPMLKAFLASGPRALSHWAIGSSMAPNENLLILVDQFEELFRYADFAERDEAERFVSLLLEAARAPDVPIHVVLTMRSEYIGACGLFPGLAEQVNSSLFLTPRMARAQCSEAIEGPAAVLGFELEPALVPQLLNDMESFAPWEEATGVGKGQILSRRADQLPLMQHLLNRMWLQARAAGDDPVLLTRDAYLALGGLSGALDQHGEQILQGLEPADRPLAQWLFRALVSGPDVTNAVRQPQRLASLMQEGAERQAGGGEAICRIIEAFRAPDCNFLQPPVEQPLTPETLIDISHESLIRQWQALAGWLQLEARAEANWLELVQDAERHASGAGELLTGLDLDRQDGWWQQELPTPTWASRHGGSYHDAKTFLDQSRYARDEARARVSIEIAEKRERDAREQRNLRRRLAITTTLSMTLTAAFAFAAWSGISLFQVRKEMRSAQLVANSARQEALATADAMKSAQYALDQIKQQKLTLTRDYDRIKKEQETLSRFLRDQQEDLQEAEDDKGRALSITGATENFVEAVEYCEGNDSEKACRIINGGMDRTLRRRRQRSGG
ncbi:hypothetical protein CHU93_05165 [Sandarakinorhabdus cyanobacteriorum]|uniref:Novel STAND NTPase 1 domain-containing protein n=2 Tax=Sandarakinorhabdus cyanobacteriorum TaxID=1981098 RepID=A0A255YPH5_9SPHN|nr:hypothetical protein CHU93_05165 [Sandarakinorhabdus cyanobacteriorum]